MDILKRILDLRLKRNWTEYRLSEEADIPQSTISSWYNKNHLPSYKSLEKICAAYRITLSQFFAEDNDLVMLTNEQKQMLDKWNTLTDKQKEMLFNFLETL